MVTPIRYVEIPVRRRPIGLGDAVAAVAQPIAVAADAALGTHLGTCGGCAARKAALNAAVPNILHLFSGDDHDQNPAR